MLSYQHGYHAGGPADLHKHAALCAVLDRLAQKEKPFVVVDLYAGHGVYGLGTAEAQKTREFEDGIGRLWPPAKEVPSAVEKLLATVAALNPESRLVRYPGSPALARAALRKHDRLILNELHPAAFADLRRWAGRDERISVHKRNGLEALIALTPPPIRRGVAVIDPSYEIKSEYTDVPEAVRTAHRKWKDGIFFVWYPVLADGRHQSLIDGMKTGIEAETLKCELSFNSRKPGKEAPGLLGTGLIIVNPPWRFDVTMREVGDWLAKALTSAGRHDVRWITSPAA
ncbi:MAG: 23S rRNA (adenine(2030)-N(6))-methyltransferase RlmJ [Rhodospirillaceae bacterium]